MTREEALILIAVVAPGKSPVADAYFDSETERLIRELLAKPKGKRTNG